MPMDGALHLEPQKLEHIARISHGKDSLKMLDVIVTRGLPLDRITTTDVWATDTIRGEHPKMVAFKERADEYIWRKYRIEVEHLCAVRNGKKMTYETQFYYVPKRRNPVRNGEDWTGRPQGFPVTLNPWCKQLKRGAMCPSESVSCAGRCETTAKQQGTDIVEYLGIAADEPKRFGQLNERKRAPLVEFGIDENLCGLHCQYEGILAPSYESSCRDGCWFCSYQGVNQLRMLRKNYPDLWALLLRWDDDSPVSFHPDGRTVRDFDRRFQLEDEHWLQPGDSKFRWEQLEGDLQQTLF